ncbi:MAG: hypothetical protein HYU87_09460 [Chloroflexi bacterium]|nr:hypothetical protein [Chloroflexota bacterium]
MSDEQTAITISLRSLRRVLLRALAAALVLVVLAVLWQQRDALGGVFAGGVPAEVDRNAYQAVFLTGGQVYFGKLGARGGDIYVLSDVYYLSEPREGNPRGQLVKRGTELHGPRDPMIIPAGQVLLIENLRDDAEVMQAIKRHRSGEVPLAPAASPLPTGTAGPSPTAATPRPTPTR